jgi:hypothetical protein
MGEKISIIIINLKRIYAIYFYVLSCRKKQYNIMASISLFVKSGSGSFGNNINLGELTKCVALL